MCAGAKGQTGNFFTSAPRAEVKMDPQERKVIVKKIKRQRELSGTYASIGGHNLTQEEIMELTGLEDELMGLDWYEILFEEIEHLGSAGSADPAAKRKTERWI